MNIVQKNLSMKGKSIMFESRNNSTTLSVYVWDITAKCYNEQTESIEKVTFQLYNEKVPSDSVLKSELEKGGYTVVGKLDVILNNTLSGLYKMNHDTFVKYGEKIGDTRPKKEK